MKIINFIRARARKYLNEEKWLQDHIKAGLKVGIGCDINPGLVIDHSHCWLIEIGDYVTIAPQVYLLAHDASTRRQLGYTKLGKVKLLNNCFVGARAIIMPGVTIGENSIVAAGSVVVKSVEANTVVGGNPARFILKTDELMEKHRLSLKTALLYDERWLIQNGITDAMKKQMSEDLDSQTGYIF